MRFPHFVVVALLGLAPWVLQVRGAVQQDIKLEISRADNLYSQAEFKEALALLTQLDEKLKGAGENSEDQSRVKMLLGLTEVALEENGLARARFVEFCLMNPRFVLDEQQYSRKVVVVYKEAEQECTKCVQICERSESFAAAGNLQGASELKPDSETCGCAARIAARDDAALRHGRDLFAQGKYPEALMEYQAALTAVPVSLARRQSVQSAQLKVNALVESTVAEWRGLFSSREFDRAAAAYDRLRAVGVNATGTALDGFRQVSAQYQTTFESLTTRWDAACAKSDKVALFQIREWGFSLDPKRTIQPEMLDRMRECNRPAAPRGNVTK